MGKLGRTGRKRLRRKKKHKCIESIYDGKLFALMKWAKKNGVYFGKVKPAVFAGTGRGLKACKKLKKGDCIVSVPVKLLITPKTVYKSEAMKLLSAVKEKLSIRQMVCVFLIYERFRGQDSFWFPYISTLPDTFSTPCYFDSYEMEILPESYYQLFMDQRNTVLKEYQELLDLIEVNFPETPFQVKYWLTLDNYKWAWCVVNTRSVYMPRTRDEDCATSSRLKDVNVPQYLQKQEGSYALAPVLDLLNHCDTAEVEAGLCSDTGRYEIHTVTEYCRNSQVFINYGPHDNKTLLIEYGFVLPNNIHDVVPISHPRIFSLIARDDVLGRAKIAIVKKNGLDNDFSISESCGASWSLLVSLRILAMDNKDLQSWQQALSGNVISEKNEGQVREWMNSLVKNTLSSYKTTVEEDQRLVEQTVYSENKRLAAQFLIQEKLTLQGTLKYRLC